MPEYHITWSIDLHADTPREAAEQALIIQRDPASGAVVFVVAPELGTAEFIVVDLDQ